MVDREKTKAEQEAKDRDALNAPTVIVDVEEDGERKK